MRKHQGANGARIGWIVAGALALGAPATASGETAAVPPIAGPKPAAAAKLAGGIAAGLEAGGFEVVSSARLAAAAKKARAEKASPEAAAAAGAEILVLVELTKSKTKWVAQARALSSAGGEELARQRKAYRPKEAQKIGREIGEALARAARSALAPPPPPPRAVKPVAPEPEEPAPRAVPVEEKPVAVAALAEPGAASQGPEDAVFRLALGAGTQVASAYTVAVGAQVTGLAYTLSPLMLIDVAATVSVPGVGLGATFDFSFVPVRYAIDVDPPVDPAEPSGRFMNLGGTAFWTIPLARFGDGEEGMLFVAPLLGGALTSMSAEPQGENTVVVSWNAFDLSGGVRLGVRASRELAFEVDGRGGLVLGYGESPATTGEGGSGLSLRFGGAARYWMSDNFGLFLGARYHYQRVGLSGVGTRTPFVDDPVLQDATVFSGDLKVSAGLLLAL